MIEMSKNTNYFFRNKKLLLVLLAMAILGVILMCVVGNDEDKEGKPISIEDMDPAEYARSVEERVKELCNRIDGVSSTYAVVTLKGGYRAIYASDIQSGSNSKNQTVIIGSGSAEKGLLVGYDNPEIGGIGIVCSGGDDYNVKKNIIAVVSSAFDIPSNKIFVAGS